MVFSRAFVALSFVLVLPFCICAPRNAIAFDQKRAPDGASARAAAVKEAFQFAWNGYYKYAFPNDELLPVSNGHANTLGGWGASAVDALSTAIIMEDRVIVNEIINYIPTIDWPKTYQDESISLFETTIRFIGGLLSAYDFLKGPMASLVDDKSKVDTLLTQAVHLANNMSYTFQTKSGIPYNNLKLSSRGTDGASTNGLATIGTLVLEWTHLSDLTGNKTYAAITQKAESYLLSPKPLSDEPFPGLLGTDVGISDGSFVDASGGWIGGDDSFYEYLIKMYVYDSTRFSSYKDRWVTAVESSMAYLASHPSSRPDLTFLAAYDGKATQNFSEHLACFDGGNFVLGGLVLSRKDILNFGLKLVAGCHDTYVSTATGIGPEVFSWDTTTLPANQAAFYRKAGFWIESADYDLRPEVMESYYYAYQATKNTKYQDWAWEAFVAINKTCRTNSGFSQINNVNVPGGGGFTDFQESFFFAELMKYSFLIFTPDVPWDVNYNGKNQWVFNTEAHPLKVKTVI